MSGKKEKENKKSLSTSDRLGTLTTETSTASLSSTHPLPNISTIPEPKYSHSMISYERPAQVTKEMRSR